MDGGPLFFQEAVDISDLNTAEEIQNRVLEIEHRILPLAVKLYCENRIIIDKGRTIIK